jgi:Rrf2 family protein
MRLTNATSYAICALVHLAGQKGNQPVASHRIARRRGVPEKFLLKVLKPLATSGILRSVKGPHGGYRLAKTPKDITLLEIVENVEGPIRSQGGFEGSSGSHLRKKLQAVWDRADEEIRRQLGKVRLSDLAAKG